ncbi:peptidoglycan-binding protein [Streptomyces sp. NPDC057376]|uniref:peptidoglycan-binding domain-containing protein n=1 Tax=Streptomyces sp. NPDC057376 TaxID=3346110 RepID=UPI003630DE43
MTITRTARLTGTGIATVALASTVFAGSAHAKDDLKEVRVTAGSPCTNRHIAFTVNGTPYHGFDYSRTLTTIISKGSQGNTVKEAQCLLEYVKCSPGTVDGIFGDNTRAATIRFQKKNGLKADGSIGPKTCPKLRDLNPTDC